MALNNDQFKYVLTDQTGVPNSIKDKINGGEHVVLAHHESEKDPIGVLAWGNSNAPEKQDENEPDSGTRGGVTWLETHNRYQRLGVATRMWETALEHSKKDKSVIPPEHSNTRTKAGDAWAKTVGGHVPNQWGSFIPVDESNSIF